MKNDDIRTVIDTRLADLHGTSASKERILQHLRGEKFMKKKMKMVAIAALVMVLALMITAIAIGNNLFGLFVENNNDSELNTALKDAAKNAVLSTNEPVSFHDEGWVQIDSTFFDDQKLMVAYKLKDNANIAEKWQPTADELQRMVPLPKGQLLFFTRHDDINSEFYKSYEAGKPCGVHITEIERRDHAYTDDGIDLVFTDDGFKIQNGILLNYVLFDELPEEVRKRDSVNVALRFSRYEYWTWFDGKTLYEMPQSKSKVFTVEFTATKAKSR